MLWCHCKTTCRLPSHAHRFACKNLSIGHRVIDELHLNCGGIPQFVLKTKKFFNWQEKAALNAQWACLCISALFLLFLASLDSTGLSALVWSCALCLSHMRYCFRYSCPPLVCYYCEKNIYRADCLQGTWESGCLIIAYLLPVLDGFTWILVHFESPHSASYFHQ